MNQDIKVEYSCNFCEKVYIVKASYQSHMRKKHTEQVQSAKNANKPKLTMALENSKAGGVNEVSIILAEVLTSVTKKKGNETNQSNDEEEPLVQKDDDVTPPPKSSVDPNNDWLAHTNTDLGLMLECAQLSLALEQCDECEYTLEFGETLNDHKTSEHMGELSKVCSNCGEFFSTITNLNEHNLAKHTPSFSGITTCKGCIKLKQIEGFKNVALEKKEETIKQLGVKLRQMAGEKKALREKVAKLEKANKETKEHESNEDNVADLLPKEYDCKKCKFTSSTVHDFYNHLKQKHKSKYKCQMCSMTFMFKPTLKAHMKQKHNFKIVKQSTKECHECKMKDEIIKHKEEELDKKEKENDIDQLHQKHEAMKERYTNVLRSLGDKKQLFKENTKLREETKTSAEELQKAYKKVQILEEANKVMKAVIDADEAMKENQEFIERTADMTEEVREHNRPIINCPKCKYKTKNSTHMKGHMTSHNGNSFKCEEEGGIAGLKCGKIFETKDEVESHINVNHKKETPKFNCNKCDKEFETHSALKQHAQSKHEASERLPVGHQRWATQHKANQGSDVVKYKCTKCPAEFNSEQEFRSHNKVHVFTIPCNMCNDMFETKEDQNHHNRTVHEGFRKVQKACRYFAQGWCEKQHMCNFSHILPQNQWPQYEQEQQTPLCRRGPGCLFWARGTCYFLHSTRGQMQEQHQGGRRQDQEQDQGIRRQQQEQHFEGRRLGQEQGQDWRKNKMCLFQERCWNQECPFKHKDFCLTTEFLENY